MLLVFKLIWERKNASDPHQFQYPFQYLDGHNKYLHCLEGDKSLSRPFYVLTNADHKRLRIHDYFRVIYNLLLHSFSTPFYSSCATEITGTNHEIVLEHDRVDQKILQICLHFVPISDVQINDELKQQSCF